MSEETAITTVDEVEISPVTREASLALAAQFKLPRDVLRMLASTEEPLTDAGLDAMIALAKLFMVPLTGLNLIPTQTGQVRIFINQSGVLWRLHNDKRGIASIHTEIVHEPTPEEPFVRAKATVTLRDGSKFENEAWATFRYSEKDGEWYERTRRGLWRPVILGDRIMATATRAARRAGVLACGATLPVYEDYIGEFQEALPKQNIPVVPRTFAELINASRELGFSPNQIAEMTGLSLAEIAKDPARAWKLLTEPPAEGEERGGTKDAQ
jgi:hypothetical protein